MVILYLLLAVSLNAVNLSDYINHQNCDQIIDKQIYTICYSYKYKGAKYVAYTLDGSKVNKLNIKKRPKFYSEKLIPLKYRGKSNDYKYSGYDRGHLASDASFDYDKKALSKVYTMANIIPQSPQVNRKLWLKAENLERYIAVKLGSVSVMNGVVYSSNPKRIGKNNIAVPIGFWKKIYNDSKKYQKCFYYKNSSVVSEKNDRLKSHLIKCNKL